MVYREPLPDGCPPEEAEDISGFRIVFRLVRHDPPANDDFKSQRAENPNRKFGNISECRLRGLSVHDDLKASKEIMKLPTQRGKRICRVRLNSGAGRIQKTGRVAHYTWWPFSDFDIVSNCSLVRR